MSRTIDSVALIEPSVEAECLTTEVFWQIRSTLPFLAGALGRAGFGCRVYCDELLRMESRFETIVAAHQAVGLSVTINTVERALEIARALKSRNPGLPVIFGGVVAGHFACSLLRTGDFVVLGRGEIVLPRLLAALNAGTDPGEVHGLGFVAEGGASGEVRFTPPEDGWADNPSDFDAVERYGGFSERKNLFGLPKPPIHSLFFSTGCVFRCRFCMSERQYRTRSVENVVADLRAILAHHRTLLAPRLMLVDDCPFGDIGAFSELLVEMARVRGERNFSVMMQFHVKPLARHADLPRLLTEAGVSTLLIGFETASDTSLSSQNKGTTVDDNVRAIRICREHGISPYGYFVVGFETDTPDVVRDVFRFILDQRLVAQVLPVGVMEATPAARGTQTSMPTLDPFSFGATIFVSHRHPTMRAVELQRLLIEGYERIFSFSRAFGLPTLRETVYQLAYAWAYRKWRPRLHRHLATLARLDSGSSNRDGPDATRGVM